MKIDSKLDPEVIIFDNQEFLKVMNISKRTAQQWRDTGYIGFSQLGNKIYYRLSDIKALLNANYNPKK
jgi:predicted site-specific integrase-resolvase